jgi:hypothetical protein
MGIALVGFGIPIYEFGTGNTLIGAGIASLVGGFILLGLWAAVVELDRVRTLLDPRTVSAGPGQARERRPAISRAALAGQEADLQRRAAGEEFDQHETHEAANSRAGRAAAERFDRPAWFSREGPQDEQGETAGAEYEAEEESTAGPKEKAESWDVFAPNRPSGPARERSFEAIWPSETEARDEAPATPEPPRRPSEAREAGRSTRQEAPTILKSGVINGMAYTLYTDGSIEAELPQGTLRFGSLEELRDYLADNP